ncbi:hypothetical protein IRZ83_18805 [Flavobacterium sp. JLP]|uniref:hypothetical protein n=1 Tax=unclassified Flavobacterium TaxID=196869 RepID=UPI00188CB9B5|nr:MULTISPECIES: hypothetical protein [unclassified Flavobacterium]MBF4494389.1 hypothetical protein [Flavobacterium sp. MR2016-29]MBF4508729.1 hypothetical protein [Flavobacterium sp. JLP]
MKKIVSLFSVVALLFASCSKDDSVNSKSENLILPKTIKLSDPNYSSENLTNTFKYDGNKIVSITNERGKTEYTYNGNLIVKEVNSSTATGIQKEISYSYANGKLAKALTVVPNNYSYELVYTDNNDGTFKVESYSINQKTGVKTKSNNVETLTFSNGNLNKAVLTYGNTVETNVYDYDTQSNPFKNIEGFNLLNRVDISSQLNILSANNIIKQTSFNIYDTVVSDLTIYTSKYDYDTKGYPIKKTLNNPDGTVNKIYEYIY